MAQPSILSLDIVLNELSFEPVLENIYLPRDKMDLFLRTLRQYMSIAPEEIKSLLVHTEVMQITLANGYTIQSWCCDQDVEEDQRRFFLGLSTARPFINMSDIEARCNNRVGQGLAIAAFCELPGISITFHEEWNLHILQVEIVVLNDSGEDYETRNVDVLHACRVDHVGLHVGRIRERIEKIKRERKDFVKSGAELWNRREELFPHLAFGADLYRELRKLRPGDQHLSHIVGRFFSLERYCAGWEAGSFDPKQLPGEPRQESEATLQQYGDQRKFAYPDGEKKRFSWHISIPIEGWRLYFEPLSVESRDEYLNKRMVIGSVVSHLDTKKFH